MLTRIGGGGRDAATAATAAVMHPGGMEPTLVRHALLALAGGAASVPRARHLLPRVLALLRGANGGGGTGGTQHSSGEQAAAAAAVAAASNASSAAEFSRLVGQCK